MTNDDLLKAYKNTRVLITQTPADKEKIINEYIDLVIKINNLNETPKTITNDTNNTLANMLKNPLEISIYNNFQKYNDVKNNKTSNATLTATNEKQISITELAKINEYTKK